MTTLTTTYKKDTLVEMLTARVAEVHADYDRQALEYEEELAKAAVKQAAHLRKLADRIESGKLAPVTPYALRHEDEITLPKVPDKPKRAFCRAESLLKQVKASNQSSWRLSTDQFEAIFGSDCKV